VDTTFRRIINLIDVLWLRGDDVIAAYEIEHTTSISSGLLRLYDLDVLCPTHIMHLCVVIPHPSLKRFQAVLARPAFQRLNMQKRCLIIQEETLLQHAEHILRWASSPTVITRLAWNMEQS
jgi:type II restriction enzyme